ncbi:MAG: 6,7-dimethyl-8-ribityllumazine synthase [Longimicrobiales bacterium]
MGSMNGKGRRFAIVVSRFNELVTDRLLAGAQACLEQHDVASDDVVVYSVPGAWELPLAADRILRAGGFDGVVALGCVIRGETPHFDYVSSGATNGLLRVALDHGAPVAFGVLTTDDTAQAMARAGGKAGNKGWEAALTVLEMADLYARIGGADA